MVSRYANQTYCSLTRHASVCNTLHKRSIISIIDVKKTTTWGESGFPSEFLGDPTEILDQEELLSHGILSFAGHSLDLRKQIIPTLIATRRFIYDVISEIGTTETYNGAIEMGPFEDG